MYRMFTNHGLLWFHRVHLSLSLSLSGSLSISWKIGRTGQGKNLFRVARKNKNGTIKTSAPVPVLTTVPPMAEWGSTRGPVYKRVGSSWQIVQQREDARWPSPWELCRPHVASTKHMFSKFVENIAIHSYLDLWQNHILSIKTNSKGSTLHYSQARVACRMNKMNSPNNEFKVLKYE